MNSVHLARLLELINHLKVLFVELFLTHVATARDTRLVAVHAADEDSVATNDARPDDQE